MSGSTSHALRRHLERLSPSLAASPRVLDRRKTTRRSASLELHRPTAYPDPKALFFTLPFRRKRLPRVALRGKKCRPQGLATLSTGSSTSDPWRPISSSNALGLPSPELFSPAAIGRPFPATLSVPALGTETSRLRSRAPTAWSHGRSRPPTRPQRIKLGRRHCSPEVFGPFGPSLRKDPPKKHLPFSVPLAPLRDASLTTHTAMSHRGFRSSRFGIPPLTKGAGPFGLSADCARHLFKR